MSSDDLYPPIGVMRTPFREKFGVPRQGMMMVEARGVLKLKPEFSAAEAFTHLNEFSHLWILFRFHKNDGQAWRRTIDPPRLGAPTDIGVFASRSPHRPNPIGLSVVKLDRIDLECEGGVEIHVSGVDILDETPVLDIKPYVPYADRIDSATDGWAPGENEKYPVVFSSESLQAMTSNPDLKNLIAKMLESDPRPISQRRSFPIQEPKTDGRRFAFRVEAVDVQWEVRQGTVYVVSIESL